MHYLYHCYLEQRNYNQQRWHHECDSGGESEYLQRNCRYHQRCAVDLEQHSNRYRLGRCSQPNWKHWRRWHDHSDSIVWRGAQQPDLDYGHRVLTVVSMQRVGEQRF